MHDIFLGTSDVSELITQMVKPKPLQIKDVGETLVAFRYRPIHTHKRPADHNAVLCVVWVFILRYKIDISPVVVVVC